METKRKAARTEPTAAEYVAGVADRYSIESVAQEVEEVKHAPSVRNAVAEFWCDFWREIARRYV